MKQETIKNIFTVVAIVLILFVAYSFFFGGDSEEDALLIGESSQESKIPQAARDLLAVLKDLQEIKLNIELFQDRAFRELQDFGVQLVSEPQGRTNPFAPLQ